MNSPLFSPIWFYFIELFGNFRSVFITIGLFNLISSAIVIFLHMINGNDISKYVKKITIMGAIVVLIGSIMPSKETCYKMIVASYVTPANIELAKGEAADLIDYIIEKVDKLNNKEESD